jgi:hypothetical protein
MPRAQSPIAVVLMLAMAACVPKHPSAAKAAMASGLAPAAADPYATGARCYAAPTAYPDLPMAIARYPGWARAAFPPYPNARPTPCIEGTFEFQTGDDPAIVLAWYKAHTTATWGRDEIVPNGWDGWTSGAEINIGSPPAPTDSIKTVIDVQPLERFTHPKG